MVRTLCGTDRVGHECNTAIMDETVFSTESVCERGGAAAGELD